MALLKCLNAEKILAGNSVIRFCSNRLKRKT
uniref:Uncharacterized protein n=1 Tax=Tetranychus urticae TaxID=32264 RepID=T1KS09_TETUR